MTEFKDILGKPSQGIHFHVPTGPNGIAVMDLLMTVLLVIALAWWFGWNWKVSGLVLAFLLTLAEVLHLLIGVDTTVARWLRG